MRSILCFPHGLLGLAPAVLVTLGWMGSLFQDGCDYAKVSGSVVAELVDETSVNEIPPWLEWGVSGYRIPTYDARRDTWETVYTGSCWAYPLENADGTPFMDGAWQTSRWLAFFSLVLGGSATVFLGLSSCCLFSSVSWRFLAGQVLLACLTQSLAFLWFINAHCQENDCQMFWGSRSDIIAASLWGVAGIFMLIHYPRPREGEEADKDGLVREDTEATQDEAVADGSITTITTNTEDAEPKSKDGSVERRSPSSFQSNPESQASIV